jgi:hypothetical protein
MPSALPRYNFIIQSLWPSLLVEYRQWCVNRIHTYFTLITQNCFSGLYTMYFSSCAMWCILELKIDGRFWSIQYTYQSEEELHREDIWEHMHRARTYTMGRLLIIGSNSVSIQKEEQCHYTYRGKTRFTTQWTYTMAEILRTMVQWYDWWVINHQLQLQNNGWTFLRTVFGGTILG